MSENQSTTSAQPRPRLSSAERKQAIVDAAVHLFAQRGFRGTTTREIASAVGVTEPVLYQHFSTKRDLYAAIIEAKAHEGPGAAVQMLSGYLEGENDQEFFALLGEGILAWYLDDPRYIRLLLYSALEGHELSELFYERQIVSFYDMLTSYLQRRIEAGAFRKMDPVIAARTFVGMFAHTGQIGAVHGKCAVAGDRRQMVDAMVGIYLEGMRNREE
jgi:AcrR family transcriptional regulator